MNTKPIGEASHGELFYHASTILGLEVKKVGSSKPDLLAAILQAAPDTTHVQLEGTVDSPAENQARATTAEQAAAAAAQAPQVAAVKKAALAGMSAKQAAAHHHDPKIEILIAETPEPGGDRDVEVAVNGVAFIIKRNQWVAVPYRVFEVLKNAVQTVWTPKNDSEGRLTPEKRDVYSYPFQTRNEPSEAELAEWRERVDAVELA